MIKTCYKQGRWGKCMLGLQKGKNYRVLGTTTETGPEVKSNISQCQGRGFNSWPRHLEMCVV